MEVYRKRRLLLLSLVSAFICSVPSGASDYSGLITVIPEAEYVQVGSNFTVYCSITRSMSSNISRNLVWSKGYPPFLTFTSKNPDPTPVNETRVINDTTMSITFFNMKATDTDYYYCYLEGTQEYRDTDHCDIHVIEFPQPLENLTCGVYNFDEFYCSWEDQNTYYPEVYSATYKNRGITESPPQPIAMSDCGDRPTPGVPDDYVKRCGNIVQYDLEVNVEITNPLGSSTSSIRFEVLPAVKPLPLENVIATNIEATSVSITGGPPPHFENILYLSKYEVSFALAEGGEWQTIEINKNELDTTLHDLHPNTHYNVRARSKTQRNWSEWSDNTTFKTHESKPTTSVSHLELYSVGKSDEYHRNVQVTWEGLNKYERGADTFEYFVELLKDNGTDLVVDETDTTSDNEETFLYISKFHTYKIRVTPRNHLGSAPTSVITVNDLSGVPGKPHNLRWVPFNTTTGTLFWGDPVEPNSIISEFRVEWRKVHEHQGDMVSHSGVLVKKPEERNFLYTVGDLATYELYRFSVCSVGRDSGQCRGQSESETTGLTLQGAPENPPAGFHAEPAVDGHSLLLTWRVPLGDHNGVIVNYLINYCQEDVENEQDCLLSEGSVQTFNCSAHTVDESVSCTLTDLRPFTSYRLTVAAKSGNIGPPSSAITVRTAQSTPGPPRNLMVTSKGSMVIRVTWDAPVNMNGVFSHYLIMCKGCQSDKPPSTGNMSISLDVYGDTKVNVSVRTCLVDGTLPYSKAAGPVTFHTSVGRPSAPTDLEIPHINHNTAVLKWDTPNHPNGPIAGYRVQYRKSSEDDWQETIDAKNKSQAVQVNCKLGMENMYDFSVMAGVQNGSTIVYGDPSYISNRKLCAAHTTWTTFMMVVLASMAILVVVVCLIVFIRYHHRVKKNLPDPYFIDSVKSSIYGHNTWTYNESQFFILERESFDALRCVDDSTQLLGLDRMHSTEGSTSSSDQGIHDMDGRLATTGSCSRLVPDGKEEEKGNWKRPLRVLCEDFDKDPDFTRDDDAVFPEDTDNYGPSDSVTVSLSYSSSPLQNSTPPNSPASMAAASNHSSERIDSGTASCCGEPTKYAKLTDSQLSPTSTVDDSSRPLSSASEDSMNYTRIGENSAASPSPDASTKQELPKVFNSLNSNASGHFGSSAAKGGVSPDSQKRMTNKGTPAAAVVAAAAASSPVSKEKSRHPSTDSSSDELSGYCKQDLTGLVNPVTSSGVSSLGEDYSRIAEGDAQASGPVESLSSYPVEDPYVTDQQMRANEGRFQSSENPTPLQDLSPTVETSPYTSPYVTSEHAV